MSDIIAQQVKDAKSLELQLYEGELSENYMRACLEKEIKESGRATLYLAYFFILPVGLILCTVFFCVFGAVGFLPLCICLPMFLLFLFLGLSTNKDAKSTLEHMKHSPIIVKEDVCLQKAVLTGVDCRGDENREEFYVYFSLCGWSEISKSAFGEINQGDTLTLAGAHKGRFLIAFKEQRAESCEI